MELSPCSIFLLEKNTTTTDAVSHACSNNNEERVNQREKAITHYFVGKNVVYKYN